MPWHAILQEQEHKLRPREKGAQEDREKQPRARNVINIVGSSLDDRVVHARRKDLFEIPPVDSTYSTARG